MYQYVMMYRIVFRKNRNKKHIKHSNLVGIYGSGSAANLIHSNLVGFNGSSIYMYV